MKQLNNKFISYDKKRYLIEIYGMVQGIGFRPFVYNEAVKYKVKGFIKNSNGHVIVDVTGNRENIKHFLIRIIKSPPRLTVINKVTCISLKYLHYNDFKIEKSLKKQSDLEGFILQDLAVCGKCVNDIMNKTGNRYRYAFTNCTKCGPRYSIIKELPYDRENTTMDTFKMCKECKDEYRNPSDRRFYSQGNCCKECGPSLILIDNKGKEQKCIDEINETINLIKSGKIVAIKGIGGFHLVCSGKDENVITKLRQRKKRPNKPLALMMKDISIVKKYCIVNKKEEEILKSNKRPIVLLTKKDDIDLPFKIAPNQNRLGIMLPYAPIHYLLMKKDLDVIVMTSGNISGCPMEYKNVSAFNHLKTVADYFLIHNRKIYVPVDDSVVKVFQGKICIIRIGRGYAPMCEKFNIKDNIIALGSEQKSTISISKNNYIYTSQYLGDLENLNYYENYKYVLNHLVKLLNVKSNVYAEDIHPLYISNKYAKNKPGIKLKIQHHYAHMVSCMAEYNISQKVIGIIYDGTGFGTDGNIWGGEFFIGTREHFKRAGHFQYINIQGGDKSIKEPWRCAASYLHFFKYPVNKFLGSTIDNAKIDVVIKALNSSLNCYKSSSVGRFFDCISALLGNSFSTYDGEAAINLENILDENIHDYYNYKIVYKDKVYLIEIKDIISGVLIDICNKVNKNIISSKFHNTISKLTCDLVLKLSKLYGIQKVVLSGGVFQNEHLLNSIYECLRNNGLQVFFNCKIPINDSGISFGQIAIAEEILRKKV